MFQAIFFKLILEMFGSHVRGKYHRTPRILHIGELQLVYFVETLMLFYLYAIDGKIFYGPIFILS